MHFSPAHVAVQLPFAEELLCNEVAPRRYPEPLLPEKGPKPLLPPVKKGGRGTTIGGRGGRNCCRCRACGSSSCNRALQ